MENALRQKPLPYFLSRCGLGIFIILFIGIFISGNTTLGVKLNQLLQKSSPEPVKLLQFTSGSHIMGFKEKEIYVAAADHLMKIRFKNANPVAPTKTSGDLFNKDLFKKAAPFKSILYKNLWDGVSLQYDNQENAILRSTYFIDPSVNDSQDRVSQIKLVYNNPVEIDSNGSLLIRSKTGQMKESAPIAWQMINGSRKAVDVSFRKIDQHTVGFSVGSYNSAYGLIIDPTLTWTTSMGGAGNDGGRSIAVDGFGNVYVTGISSSNWGSPVNAYAGGTDAFAARLDSDGVMQRHTLR